MTVPELLGALEAHGATLTLHGETVKVRAPAPLPDALMAALRLHKGEVVVTLRRWGERGALATPSGASGRKRVCYACGGTTWWRLPANVGGDLRCSRCHPQPAGYQGEARKRWGP